MKNYASSASVAAMILLVGCGGSNNLAPVDHHTHAPKTHAVIQDNIILPIFAPESEKTESLDQQKYTVQWGNEGRGGAAKKIPGYVHVLGEDHRHQTETTDQEVKYRHEVWENPKTVEVPKPQRQDEMAKTETVDPDAAVTKPIPDSTKPKVAEPIGLTPDDQIYDVDDIYNKFCRGEDLSPKEQVIFDMSGGVKAIPKHLAETCNYQK